MNAVVCIGFAGAMNNLSELLDRVDREAEFAVTRHDRAVARHLPAQSIL